MQIAKATDSQGKSQRWWLIEEMRIFSVASVVKYSRQLLYILFGLFLWYHGNLAQIVIKINVVIHQLWPSGSSKASFPGKKEGKRKSFLFIRLSLYNRKCYVASTCTKKVQLYFLPIHVHLRPQSNRSGKIRSRSISRHYERKGNIIYASENFRERVFFFLHYYFNM